MQIDVFALLAEARQRIAALRAAIEAKREFWLAQSELKTAVYGGGAGETQTQTPPPVTAQAGAGGQKMEKTILSRPNFLGTAPPLPSATRPHARPHAAEIA